MNKNKTIARIMSKEMDRKDFLKYSGGVLLAVVGITGLLETLSRIGSDGKRQTGGYGGSSYGR